MNLPQTPWEASEPTYSLAGNFPLSMQTLTILSLYSDLLCVSEFFAARVGSCSSRLSIAAAHDQKDFNRN